MKYSVEKHERYAIFQLQEDKLTSVNTPDFKGELVMLNNNGIASLVLNMAPVQYVDSSGMSALLMANRLCGSLNGALVLTNLQDKVEKMLKIAHLDEVLNILPTQQEAVDAIHMHELERDLMEDENWDEQTPRDADERLEGDPGNTAKSD